ncbi:valyl-tRNA synthetase [Angomonas deanei]|uniref:Valine--tRNA ligase, mitochondrial n=1 Tax=Angomonas deanei TaxID=59799 RepID=A0A7G2CF36_9TRYP|nr:valyl-tRNA synthetase [Angomonas deanei]CAD2217945.1 tRNA synthetases class I (I, L, M and V)/Anticodon-binding domain of tRNA/Valyl tRNA synthetase tRNA binding arm, putative [Angomonas deanei]|eukprot:EPY25369.1 valyl-tRNA synthetase [Angomonas deanei]
MKEEGKSRQDLGREEFLKRVWDFKENHAGMITKQLREIGLSLDWSREHFTMDSHCAGAVIEAFVKLHEDGLIHRSTRLVNWCCALQSAISDLEVEFEDVPKNAKLTIPGYAKKVDMGVLTHVAYKLEDSDDELIIATTRPETLLGDTAVAVHPDDERYKKFHGKRLKCPFRDDLIPIVLDSTLVDMNFGTGAVKITPAHDPNDFEAGARHNLPQLTMMDLKGYVTMEPFKGMHRFDCRKEIVKQLESKGLLREIQPYEYRVGRCSRTGDIVEPLLMPQWFVDCTEMARLSVEAVRNKELRLFPTSHESVWFHWLENIKPWCVSRQLWWGHRIPAYKVIGKVTESHDDPWVVARDMDEAKAKAKAKFNLSDEDLNSVEFDQDPDVLDTWFSSALWPFSTLKWPQESEDMKNFFPTSLMETGHDIIFFWVARMVMTSLHFTGQLPFKEVFFHAMVRDKNGEKMSKSKGNVIDPLFIKYGASLEDLHNTVRVGNLSEKEVDKAIKQQKEAFPEGIPQCGSDALRFGLLSYTQSGRSVNLDVSRIVGYRQFCNKIWNVVRYILFHALGEQYKPVKQNFDANDAAGLPLECRWIFSRFDAALEEVERGMSEGQYDFALTTTAVYRFWLYELCDVFLELTKPTIQQGGEKKQLVQDVLLCVVEKALRLLHPMMPFVTEELWHRLPHYETFDSKSIMLSPFPQSAGWKNDAVEEEMDLIKDIVHNVRSSKASYNLTNKHRPDIWVVVDSPKSRELLERESFMISTLGVINNVTVLADESTIPSGCGFSLVTKGVGVHMMLVGFIDVDKEVAKLEKQIAGLTKQLEGLKKKMSIPDYEKKVPQEVRNANTEKLQGLEAEQAQLRDGLEKMKKMK